MIGTVGFTAVMVVIKSVGLLLNQLGALLEGILSVKYHVYCFRFLFHLVSYLLHTGCIWIIIGHIFSMNIFVFYCFGVDCISGHMDNILWSFMFC